MRFIRSQQHKSLAFTIACLLAVASSALLGTGARAALPSDEKELEALKEKIVLQGVPRASLERILKFVREMSGREVQSEVYTCNDPSPKWRDPKGTRPCNSEKYKVRAQKTLKIEEPRYVVSLNFAQPSTEKRLYLIDLDTGAVRSYFGTHGLGTGKGKWAYQFSNDYNSKMSSLGLYWTGDTYSGGHGLALRMHGLERSNDQAYFRDIVMHGAVYAREQFIHQVNQKTKTPRDRLGVSWGCPAVAPEDAKDLIPLLKERSLIDLYHPALMEEAQSGKPVAVTPPEPVTTPTPAPTPSPTPVPHPPSYPPLPPVRPPSL